MVQPGTQRAGRGDSLRARHPSYSVREGQLLEPPPGVDPPVPPVSGTLNSPSSELPPAPERRPSGSSIGGSPGRVSSVSAGHVPDDVPPASDPSPNERPPAPAPDAPVPPVDDVPDAPVPVVAPDGVEAV